MKYPFVKQKDLKDCGCCCLLMITRYFGGSVSLEYLRELTNTTKNGVSAFDLIEGSKKLGFSAYGVKGDITELNKKNTPCIAHVIINKSYQHFIVIYNIDHKNKTLTIADPNYKKIKKMSFEEFNKISTKTFIILTPYKKIMYVEKNKKFDKFFLNILINHKKSLFIMFFLSIIIAFSQIFLSFEFKIFLEYVINYCTIYNLLLLGLIFLSIVLLKEISSFHRNNLTNKLNHLLDKSMFNEVYNHILSLPYLYYKNRTTGEIISRLNDLTNVRNVISKFIISLLFDLVLLIISITFLFILSSKLALVIVVAILLLIMTILIFNSSLEEKITNAKEDGSKLNSFLVETIDGIETIKNQNAVSFIKKKFLIKNSLFNKNSYIYNRIFILEEFIKNLIVTLCDLAILIYGSYLCVSNQLDLATLITFITLTSYVFSPISSITDLILSIKEAKVSFNRIRELYEVDEEKNNSKSSDNNKINNIKISNLVYSYNNTYNLIKNVNMEINSGNKILIYGDSGTGKSTLAKIITGNLKTNNKSIYINDKDINKYSKDYLNRKICYISNSDKLFTTSIYNNIVMDKENLNNLDNILKICQVDEFVLDMPLAYDMLVEENGFNLSGGQKQRILLARSLLKDADIYILDETLNQVDISKERKILKDIFNYYKDKTFIYISHRFNNNDLFDKKYCIRDGVCVNESI